MAVDNLKQNIEMEKRLINEIFTFYSQLVNVEKLYPYEKREHERVMLTKSIISSLKQLKMISDAIPKILDSISPFRKLEPERKKEKKEEAKELVEMTYQPETIDGKKEETSVTISKAEKEKFLKELSLSHETLRRLKKKAVKKEVKKEVVEIKGAGAYAKLSNKFFLNLSHKLTKKGYFKKLESDLRKGNMPYLLTTYVSMCLFSTLIALIIGILIPVTVLVLSGVIDALKFSPAIIVLPLVTFASFYFYPYAERKSVEGKVDQEIPFVAIHMSAIAGSGIEPTQIFKIIALGEEYPATKKEIKKIINQVNVYGYDIVTALKNTGRETSSKKLSELLNGLASTISEGGSLTEFLDKRAESLLFDYKVEKEKSTKTAETFMDIYISIMIMAPMMMMLLLILISMTGMDIGISMSALTLIIVLVVALINIIALAFLHIKQPTY